jgi:ribonuclease HI
VLPEISSKEIGYVVTFDGSAKPKRERGACGAVIWRTPEWEVVTASAIHMEGITVNEAEYHGAIHGMEIALEHGISNLIVCGDSRLVIQQLKNEIECKASGLQLLMARAQGIAAKFNAISFVHVKREYNASADFVTGKCLQRHAGGEVPSEEYGDLRSLNRCPEVFRQVPEPDRTSEYVDRTGSEQDPQRLLRDHDEERWDHPRCAVVNTRSGRPGSFPTSWDVRDLRIDRIQRAQCEERWIADLRAFLNGDLKELSAERAAESAKIAPFFEISDEDLLYYISTRPTKDRQGSQAHFRLVLPTTLHKEILRHYHDSLEGAHQGISRTYARIKEHFYWRSLFKDVSNYVRSCDDCQTGSGRSQREGRSPGNIEATRPFQVIGMDHVPSMPRSHRGNTELLIFVDHHTGYVITKATRSRSAETVAAAYEEAVFRHYGASEIVRHDREPSFMSQVFKAFNQLIGQRSRATLAYRPQANGKTERVVQTVIRAVKRYVQDEEQRDWDDFAERIVFGLNTAYDRVRGDTPAYLLRGWDPRSTIETMIPNMTEDPGHKEATKWRSRMQQDYQRARAVANDRLQEEQGRRADRQNIRAGQDRGLDCFVPGAQVWLYIDQVKPGFARKLAHLWHGPFRIADRVDDHCVKLEIPTADYRLYPIVHVSRLKLRQQYQDRPCEDLTVEDGDRVDFDEELLPEDSWDPQGSNDEYEVEAILDDRVSKRSRQGRRIKEYLVKWCGYEDPTWEAEEDLHCPSLLTKYEEDRKRVRRYQAMQSAEEGGEGGSGDL